MDTTLIFGLGLIVIAMVLVIVAAFQSQTAGVGDLKEKLRALSEAGQKEIDLGIAERQASSKQKVDWKKQFSKITGKDFVDKLEKDLTQCDIPLKVGEFLLVWAGLIGAGLLGGWVYASTKAYSGQTIMIYALVAAGLGALLPIPLMKIKRILRINKFVLQLAEFLVLITNSLRAGQTFIQGVDIASKESPDPIGMEFRLLLRESNLGIPIEEAFQRMLIRVPSEELKIVMSAFTIQRNVGGNLADIMDKVAAMIRQRITIQNQIKVLTTQGKLSGAIVGLLPIGLGTIISTINYRYMSLLWDFHHPDVPGDNYTGPIILGIGLFMQLLGCFVIYKICDIEV